jgi:hypothetical protein
MKAIAKLIIVGLLGMAIAGVWNAVSEPEHSPIPAPSPTYHVIIWCTPVAVPLYQNGTDCQ